MSLIELYEDNAGGLYIVDAQGNTIPDLEYADSTFAQDAPCVDEWKDPDRYCDAVLSQMDNIADYDTEARRVIVYRRPGAAGRKYLGLPPDSDAYTVEEIAAEIDAISSPAY